VGANGGTRIDMGILEGMKVLRQGRGGEKDITEVMVVLSDGGNNAGCEPVLQAARQARAQGVLMISICVGSGCDAQCMRQVASSPRYYFEAESASALRTVFQQIRDIHPRLPVVMVTKSEETETLKDAIGADISDYLIKPVNPRQILSVVTRLLDGDRIRQQRLSRDFATRFPAISSRIAPTAFTAISARKFREDPTLRPLIAVEAIS